MAMIPSHISQAIEDLRDATVDGIHTINRALSPLEVTAMGLVGQVPDLEDDTGTLADIDRSTAEVRNLLDDAMRNIYDAVRVLGSVRV